MKTEEATQSIEYSRTIVPSSMRSPYWKYFGFPSDNANNILTKQKIICTLCNTPIAYNKNTSNLRTHLIAKHCELLHELQQQQQQLHNNNARPTQKRQQSDMLAQNQNQTVEATTNSCREKKLKDNSYVFQTDATNAYITADYKQQTTGLVVEDEVDDVIEMIEQAHANDDISDVEGVDYADYETEQQTADVDEEQEQQQKHVIDIEDVVVQNADESYAFVNIGNVPQKRSTAESRANLVLDFEDLVVNMLITDLLPISTVEGVGFKRLFSHLGTLDKATVEFKLSTLHEAMLDKISAHLKNICQTQPYSLGVEIINNVELLPVISIYVNYYCVKENELLSVLYRNLLMTEELQATQKCLDFENLFEELNLANCAAYVLNAPNKLVESYFRAQNIPMIPCLESVLIRCMAAIFDLPSVKREFNSVYKIAEGSVKADNALSLMLPEVYPKCAWSKLNFLQFVNENLSFNSFDSSAALNKARDLADYICPLKISLETIAEEPMSLCSLMRPFTLRLLEDNFSTFFANDDYLSEVKQILTDELTNSVLKNDFLNESTFFDGRFRRDFLDAADISAIKVSVCERFKSLFDVAADSRTIIKEEYNANSATSSSSGSNSRKSSLKSFFQRNTETSQKLVTSKKKHNIEYEFNKYNCEPALDLEQCPISWWQENSFTYKQLKKVADFYMSVPCCVNRLFRCEISERNDLQNKRYMLRNQHAQDIWYLHYNKKYYDKL